MIQILLILDHPTVARITGIAVAIQYSKHGRWRKFSLTVPHQ